MFNLTTRTSWQKTPTKISLHNITEAITPYPLIERKFFDDINTLCGSQSHYFVEMGLLNLYDHNNTELNPEFWILIWGLDFKERMFQLLIERHPDYNGKGAIAGIGPNELLEFFSGMKNNAILPTLTLLSSPNKMKSMGVIVSRPKNYQDKAKDNNQYQALGRFQNWINELKNTPNTKGQWFPSNAPICPVCNGPIVGIQDNYKVGFGFMICPECGHMERRQIMKKRDF